MEAAESVASDRLLVKPVKRASLLNRADVIATRKAKDILRQKKFYGKVYGKLVN